MASIHRRPRSKFWVAAFTGPNGERCQRSTKQTDRNKALKVAMEYEDTYRRSLSEGQIRNVLSDIHERLHGSRLESSSLADYVKHWLERKKGETVAASYSQYEGTLDRFVEHLGEKAKKDIGHVSLKDVAAFRDKVAKKATARTANNLLKIVRTMFQTAWRDGYVVENVAAKLGTLKTEDSVRRPFTLAELKLVLGKAKGSEWEGMILAGLYTGQRLKDIATLRWSNVDLQKQIVSLQTSKTGRTIINPLASPFMEWLVAQEAPDDPKAAIFKDACTVAEEGSVSPLSQGFHDLLVDAGLAKARSKDRKSTGKGRNAPREKSDLSFHSLRHTATSWLKDAGVGESVAMDLVGHDSAAISKHYTKISLGAKKEAVALLPDVTK